MDLLFLAFGGFLLYRIATVVAFDMGLSLIACLLSSITLAMICFFVSIYYARQVPKKIAEARMEAEKWGFKGADDPLSLTVDIFLAPILAASAAQSLAAWLIALGFSNRFFEEVFFGRHGIDWSNVGLIVLIFSTPVIVFFGRQAWRVLKAIDF